MLYDPKWGVEVKADPFSLDNLIAWLEKQPAKKTYCFMDSGACLLGQYYIAMGCEKVVIGGMSVTLDGHWQEMPDDFSDIPAEYPRTFGAALKRARKTLAAR
jgi:hypothetical protein